MLLGRVCIRGVSSCVLRSRWTTRANGNGRDVPVPLVPATVSVRPSPSLRRERTRKVKAIECRASERDGTVQIRWDRSERSSAEFPFVWLRDNCLCPSCFVPSAQARLVLMESLDPDVRPRSVHLDGEGERLEIAWEDGHRSSYPAWWLEERDFAPESREARLRERTNDKEPWGREARVPAYGYADVMERDDVLERWLLDLDTLGVALVVDAPRRTGECAALAERIAFLTRTNYGREFTVRAKADPSNAAYTGAKLGLHLDLPYMSHMPGVQFLHCIAAAEEGGKSQLCDGFYVAETLKERDPDSYRILTELPVDYLDVGSDHVPYHLVHRAPIIQLDEKGKPYRMNYNDQVRDSCFNVPLESVKPLYVALKAFNTLAYDNCIGFYLKPGDVMTFDNRRVLHGREAYEVKKSGERHLEGGYVDWDYIYSRIRLLRTINFPLSS